MSRLYGKSLDVYSFSRYLNDLNVLDYKKDNTKTSWDEVIDCPSKIEFYLPDSALKIIENNPIRIVNSPFVIKSAYLLSDKEEPTMYFSRIHAIEEYKRELVFFLGEMLSSVNKDKKYTDNDIPSEYSNVISLILEYLYLKEVGKDDIFSIKHINELKYNAKRYAKSYKNFQDIRFSDKNRELFLYDYDENSKENEEFNKTESQFLNVTLENLMPISSLDAVLQLIDRNLDKNSIRELLNDLILNQDNNRQAIINSIGIDSYGFKRLRKEIDMRRK